jgi:hypothetical protein
MKNMVIAKILSPNESFQTFKGWNLETLTRYLSHAGYKVIENEEWRSLTEKDVKTFMKVEN